MRPADHRGKAAVKRRRDSPAASRVPDVRHVAVNDFQQVEKGQLPVQIDDADYEARVARAESALAAAGLAVLIRPL
jgi:multidrug resistance efflux pump